MSDEQAQRHEQPPTELPTEAQHCADASGPMPVSGADHEDAQSYQSCRDSSDAPDFGDGTELEPDNIKCETVFGLMPAPTHRLWEQIEYTLGDTSFIR